MKDYIARAQAKYKAKAIRCVQLALHRENDKDILDKLDSVPNKQGYVKELIRRDIGSQK